MSLADSGRSLRRSVSYFFFFSVDRSVSQSVILVSLFCLSEPFQLSPLCTILEQTSCPSLPFRRVNNVSYRLVQNTAASITSVSSYISSKPCHDLIVTRHQSRKVGILGQKVSPFTSRIFSPSLTLTHIY